jgi:hypothetical protein
VDHWTNGLEVKQKDAFILIQTGTRRRRETAQGWEILVQRKDGSTTWVALKDMKNSHPLQLAEYAVQMRIADDASSFVWWVPYALKKHNRVIGKIGSKYRCQDPEECRTSADFR